MVGTAFGDTLLDENTDIDTWIPNLLSAGYPSPAPPKVADTAFYKCHSEGHFCDMRRNLRATVQHESVWAFRYLKSVRFPDLRHYFAMFDKLHAHVQSLNEERDHLCSNVELPEDFLKRTRDHNDDPYNFGKIVANYANAPEVGFKHTSDGIADAAAGTPEHHTCSWTMGQAGWGDDLQDLKRRIRGENMFMWTAHKGRGSGADKLSMVLEIPKSLVTNGLVSKWDLIYRKQTQRDEDNPNYYAHMTLRQQRTLPGVVKWSQTRQNRKFGLFSFGEFEGLPPRANDFFYDEIIKGGGIHGRNLTEGNPADRMQHFGMPWIGGVSGSVVDFYIAARALGYTGQDLAVLVLLDIAALVAGGQHSMGELLWAAAVCELFDGLGLSPGSPSVKDPAESFHPFIDKDGKEWYFATPWMRDVIKLSNEPTEKWNALLRTLTEEDLYNLYLSATTEFVSRSMPITFAWSQFALPAVDSASFAALMPCTKMEGAHDFRMAVFKYGAYGAVGSQHGEEHTAWSHWASDGLKGFASDTISAMELVMNVLSTLKPSWIIMAAHYTRHIPLDKKADEQFRWLRQREANLVTLYRCLDRPQVNRVFGSSEGLVHETEFKTFYRIMAGTRNIAADDTDFA